MSTKAKAVLKHSNRVFNKPQSNQTPRGYGSTSMINRHRFSRGNERTIIAAVYNRIAVDVATIEIKHSKLDESGRFLKEIKSGLNYCLNTEANIDQAGSAFIHDIVISMLDEGVVAVVPVETEDKLLENGSIDICSMRTGKIMEWYPDAVTVRLYNDQNGMYEDVTLPKKRGRYYRKSFLFNNE